MRIVRAAAIKMKGNQQSELKPENYQINAKICRLVEKFPCMYDRSHSHYLKKDVVDKAWVKISKEMDDSIPSCKERWRNIRTSFARSINVNKIPASANRTKPYYLHEELQFLARHITPGIPIPRRSNAYSSAGEESEIIEVSVGEDTFDGFALAHDDEDSQEAEQSSSTDEEEIPNKETVKPVVVNESKANTVEVKANVIAAAAATAVEEGKSSVTLVTNTNTEVEKVQPPPPSAPISPTTSPLLKRRRTQDALMHEAVEQKYTPSYVESDFDAIFLQGLLPEMKAMDFRQKILFKRRIYEVIGEVFEGTTATPTTTNATTTQPPHQQHQQQQHVLSTQQQYSANVISNNNNFTYAKISPQNNGYLTTTPISMTSSSGSSSNNSNNIYQPTVAPTMTVVNAADLAMIRRLNLLLQSPQSVGAAASSALLTSTMAAAPKNAVTLRNAGAGPATATVAVNRGALTRSSANLLRVTMVNAPAAAVAAAPQPIKTEPEIVDD